ncbi:cytochrome c-type biogenesis protein [Amaricoccus macauensis]|uniref:cytochrome c-type biogenesis protein n=1 Tax=Amaricoccus macauensis TaxID=57001 RepID=UPI003C7D8D1E
MRRLILALCLTLAPLMAQAIQPDEVLDDPEMEARARAITAELRCVVCQSESIDESNAEIARDLRLLVRERLVEGDSDAEAIDFVVDRYGEYVLMRPPFSASNALLWLSGPLFLLFGGAIAVAFIRSRANSAPVSPAAPLSEEERRRLEGLQSD